MRALCASIITTGALIGLGLTALAMGTRYQNHGGQTAAIEFIRLRQLDTGLLLILVVLLTTLLAGLATTFLGLAYHHERRTYERYGRTDSSRAGADFPG